MNPTPEAQRLLTAFDLFEAGLSMMRARFRRSRPNASVAEIEAMVSAWLLQQPTEKFGDSEDRQNTWLRAP